jgi:hypothetical protein
MWYYFLQPSGRFFEKNTVFGVAKVGAAHKKAWRTLAHCQQQQRKRLPQLRLPLRKSLVYVVGVL